MSKKTEAPLDVLLLKDIQQRLESIENRLKKLETRQHPALVPKTPDPDPWRDYFKRHGLDNLVPHVRDLPIPNPPSNTVCHKCGVDWQGVTGYCCPNSECPMGTGPITC